MALRELDLGIRLGERLFRHERVETVPFSQRVQAAINSFVEYPAAPWRQASTKHSWYLGHWFDYQVQKLAGKNGR